MKICVADICTFLEERKIEFDYKGDYDIFITCFVPLKNLRNQAITWIKNKSTPLPEEIASYEDLLVVVPYDVELGKYIKNVIYCRNPKAVFSQILEQFFKEKKSGKIDKTAIVLTHHIGKNVSVGCNAYIHPDVIIGDNVEIGNHVSIECPVRIGNDSIIHSGVVIGKDGFGYYQEEGIYYKVPHFGGVVIGERVEIGANTCIDRGTMEDTYIGDDVKIDNLCQIGHNVKIGNRAIIVACSCICGSCVLEEGVYIAPGATVMNQVSLGKECSVSIGAVVIQNVEENVVIAGTPSRVVMRKRTKH